MRLGFSILTVAAGGACALGGCGDDDGTAADRIGVAAECASNADCPEVPRGEETIQLACLLDFKGGYCGIADCQGDEDCPDGSACVSHDDQRGYCFRICAAKSECNRNRTLENEANCSANISFVASSRTDKACVPPSGG